MNLQLSYVFLILVLVSACGKRSQQSDDTPLQRLELNPEHSSETERRPMPVSDNVERGDEAREIMEQPAEGPANTVIVGKVLDKKYDKDRKEQIEPCQQHPCLATVEVITIKQKGMDYHGQLSEGDRIEVHFDFTLEPTDGLIQNLTASLPGLKKEEFFEATVLLGQTEESVKRIRGYQRLK